MTLITNLLDILLLLSSFFWHLLELHSHWDFSTKLFAINEDTIEYIYFIFQVQRVEIH